MSEQCLWVPGISASAKPQQSANVCQDSGHTRQELFFTGTSSESSLLSQGLTAALVRMASPSVECIEHIQIICYFLLRLHEK